MSNQMADPLEKLLVPRTRVNNRRRVRWPHLTDAEYDALFILCTSPHGNIETQRAGELLADSLDAMRKGSPIRKAP